MKSRALLRLSRLAAAFLWTALLPPFYTAQALILVQKGDAPVENLGWPAGSESVANLPGRLGYWEGPPFGGGQYVFEFGRLETSAVQSALETFARIESEAVELVLIPGTATSTFLDAPDQPAVKASLGMTFTVWRAENWNRLFNYPDTTFASDQPGFRSPVPPPRLTLHLDPDGALDPDKLTIPKNVTVIDRRIENAELPAEFRRPELAVVGGKVTEAASGEPIPGARVSFAKGRGGSSEGPTGEAYTSPEGTFTLSTERLGGAYVVVSADGFAPFRSPEFFDLKPGVWFGGNAMALSPAATLRGRVRTVDVDPVAGLEVRAADTVGPDGRGYPQPASEPVVTAADGTFILTELPKGGTTSIRVRGEGWHAMRSLDSHAVTDDDGIVDIVVVPTGAVEGRVEIDPTSDEQAWHVSIEPEDGAGIGKWSGSARCAPDGTFRFEHVPAGAYHVRIGSPRPSAPSRVLVEGGETASVSLKP